VAVGVVIEFEGVNIHHDERERLGGSHSATPFHVEELIKSAAICGTGERVNDGESFNGAIGLLNLLLGAFAISDVADEVENAAG